MSATADGRIDGIDTVRFLCAACVAFDHFGGLPLLPMAGVDKQHALGQVLWGINNNLFPGPAAVIVFFVVSGFCVHRPHAGGRPLALGPHLCRRFVRVCPPLFAAMLLSQLVAGRLLIGNVLWSLVCELIYYALYPLLLLAVRRLGWAAVLSLAFLVPVLLRLELGRSFGNYIDYGYGLTWLMGLPCWLSGCWLAERGDFNAGAPDRRRLWAIRLGVWSLGMVLSMLRFHTAVDFKWTLNWFAIPGALWFLAEMQAGRGKTPDWLERAGAWSYSLYLFHEVGMYIVQAWLDPATSGAGQVLARWTLTAIAGFGLSWLMYLLIERPAHHAARRLAALMPDVWLISYPGALPSAPLRPQVE